MYSKQLDQRFIHAIATADDVAARLVELRPIVDAREARQDLLRAIKELTAVADELWAESPDNIFI